MFSRFLAACAALLLASPTSVHAGLSLDEALQRHQTLLDASRSATPALTSSTPQLTLPDNLTLGVFGSRNPPPPLLRPVTEGAGGAQLLYGEVDPAGFGWRLGLGWTDRDAAPNHGLNLDGSELSVKLGIGRAYVASQRRHWSPSWVGSLILDEGAAPVSSIGWRKTESSRFESPWFAWLGPWNVDLFAGTLSEHSEPARPRLLGVRFQFMPLDGLEIGLSRTLEWGGRGRQESFGSLADALLGRDNVDSGDDTDPSNQLAGFDLRYTHRLGETGSMSVYMQGIGEDESGLLPSMYLAMFGADIAFQREGASLRLFAEHANTIAGGIVGNDRPGVAYRHRTYQQGYTQQGRPLAFPAGGDVTLSSVGLLADAAPLSAMLMLHYGKAHPSAQLYSQPGKIGGGDAELAWQANPSQRLGVRVMYWRDPAASQTRLQLWWQHLLR